MFFNPVKLKYILNNNIHDTKMKSYSITNNNILSLEEMLLNFHISMYACKFIITCVNNK